MSRTHSVWFQTMEEILMRLPFESFDSSLFGHRQSYFFLHVASLVAMMYGDKGRLFTYSYLRSGDERVDQKPKIFAHEAAQVVAARNKSRNDERSPARPKSGMQTMVERLQATTPTRPKSRAELLATAEIIIPPKPKLEKAKWTSTYAELNREEVTRSTDPFRPATEQLDVKQVSTGAGRIYSRNEQRPRPAPRTIQNLDPRNASRNPSANKDIPSTFRYENAAKSSPSRNYDRAKPWEEDMEYDGKSAFVGTTGNTSYVNLPSNYDAKTSYSRISTPKPSYFIKPMAVSGPSSLPIHPALPPYMRSPSPFSKSSVSQSLELGFPASSAASIKDSSDEDNRSDVQQSEGQQHQQILNHNNHHHTRQQEQFQLSYSINQNYRPPSSQKSTALGFSGYNRAYYSNLGKSMPNVSQISEPIPIYPYHVLVTTNFRLPKDVDRCGLEKHLSKEEFMAIFNMTRADFYRMAEWRRNQLKKRFRLF